MGCQHFKYRRQKVCSSECQWRHKTLCSSCLISHLSWWMMAANDEIMMFSLADSNPIPAECARNTQCHQWHRLCSDQVGMNASVVKGVRGYFFFFFPTAIFTKTMSTQDLASNRAYSYISRYKVLLGCGWHGCSGFTGCVWRQNVRLKWELACCVFLCWVCLVARKGRTLYLSHCAASFFVV